MAALSDYLENKLLDHLLGGGDYTPAGTLYVALFTAAPSDSGGGTECSGGSYARKSVTNNTTNWPVTSGASKSNGTLISFAAATGSWGTVTHWGIFDASSGGNLLAWGAMDSSQAVASGDTASFAIGALVINMADTVFGDTWRNAVLNLAFGGTSYARPATVYAALFTASPTSAGGGTEVYGGSYARVAVTNNSTNFPSASGGSKANGTLIAWPTATDAWGTVTDMGLYTSSSSGSLLAFVGLTASKTVASGDTYRASAGDLSISLD